MRKLICIPLVAIFAPQVLLCGFYLVMRVILNLDPDGEGIGGLKGLYVFLATCALIGGVIGSFLFLADNLPDYEREQTRLREKRERELEALDAEIGIPRIPVRK